MKTCVQCNVKKPLGEFYPQSRNKGGLQHQCSECMKLNGRVWYVANKEARTVSQKAWRDANPEMCKVMADVWHKNNFERKRATTKAWGVINKERVAATARAYTLAHLPQYAVKSAKRRAARLNATPSWANQFFIEEIYDLAQRRTKATGFKWEVDHIVPLKGTMVCGLHVETNLRVIPRYVNRGKGNTHNGE